MLALFKHTTPLVLALWAACSGAGADDEAPTSSRPASGAALSSAGAPPESAAPMPLTEEELERLLDALEQDLGGQK